MKKLVIIIMIINFGIIQATIYQPCHCKDKYGNKSITRLKDPKGTAEEECPSACKGYLGGLFNWQGQEWTGEDNW